MRKVIIATAVALVLFVVGAFAASFTLNAEDVASGEDDVNACADIVDLDFSTVYDGTGDWDVDGATLNYNAGADCTGFDVTVEIHGGANDEAPSSANLIGSATAVSGAGSATVSFTTGALANLKASQIGYAAVLIDGELLTVDPE